MLCLHSLHCMQIVHSSVDRVLSNFIKYTNTTKVIYIRRSAAVDLAAALSPPVCEKKSDGSYVQPLTLRVKGYGEEKHAL